MIINRHSRRSILFATSWQSKCCRKCVSVLNAYEQCPNCSFPFSCNLYGQTITALYNLKCHWQLHHANVDIPAAFQHITRRAFITATANILRRAWKIYKFYPKLILWTAFVPYNSGMFPSSMLFWTSSSFDNNVENTLESYNYVVDPCT